MKLTDKLAETVRKNNSRLCVGLDPDPELMPGKMSVLDFNRAIIEATADLVCAYKPNLAFYEALGSEGYDILKRSIQAIPDDIPVIGDAKRGDIGNTSRAYARALFVQLGFDAVTVNPYLGFDSIEPFLEYHDRGVFILCRTSNAGAKDFQSLRCQVGKTTQPLFEIVASKANQWNTHGNIGLVVGATYPEELKLIRQRYPDMLLLIPGVGAQGGDLAPTIRYGFDTQAEKTVISSSRQILYASRGRDFATAARNSAAKLRDRINQQLAR